MKKENWETPFQNVLEDFNKKGFTIGETDCLCFITEAIKPQCDIDILDGHAGEWDGMEDGLRLIEQYRGSMEGILDHHFKRVHINFAQRGDVCLVKFEDGAAYGVVSLDGRKIAFKGEEGLRVVTRSALVRLGLEMIFWRIEQWPQ